MKKILQIIILSIFSCASLFAQEDESHVKYDKKNDQLDIANKGKSTLKIGTNNTAFNLEDICEIGIDSIVGDLKVSVRCTNGKPTLFEIKSIPKDESGREISNATPKTMSIYFCKGGFTDEKCKDTDDNKNDENLLNIPIPYFADAQVDNKIEVSDKNRYLIIDAGDAITKRNNNLYKRKVTTISTEMDEASSIVMDATKSKVKDKASSTIKDTTKSNENNIELVLTRTLPIHGSITIWVENYRQEIENITVTLVGEDFSFQKSLQDILNLTKTSSSISNKGKETELGETPGDDVAKATNLSVDKVIEKTTNYLNNAYERIKDHETFSIDNFRKLQDYKVRVEAAVLKLFKDKVTPNKVQDKLNQLLSWYPRYIDVTTISPAIENFDQVSVLVGVTQKGGASQSTKVGTYYTSGNWAKSVNTMVFISNLKNRSVFTEEVMVGENQELRANMNEKDNTSVGIGATFEASYRTGSNVRPTINIGFFIPFEEEIIPIFTIGPGISLTEKNLKLGASFGLATGKINTINERFRDRDLNNVSDLSELEVKVWKFGWYLSIGVSFNL